ncbi:hypothetical protein [Cytobacillus praedii]|uniref:hypothetical protein n=1 Tax=Cytobacillus praedii TaxID=1742358 RepID=UPI00399D5351
MTDQLQHYLSVQNIRGLGLLIGIECREPIALIIQELLQQGLLVHCIQWVHLKNTQILNF